MSGAIVIQPDGRLALWSTNVDALVVWDATDDELIDYLAAEAAERARESTRRAIERVRAGGGPRGAPPWDAAVAETRRRFPGDGAVSDLLQPHEGITGTDRPDDPLLSSPKGSRLIAVLVHHLSQSLMFGRREPMSNPVFERMRNPRPGDAVVVSDALNVRSGEMAHEGVGYLVEVRREWSTTDAVWEQGREEQGLIDADRSVEPAAWYVQYGPAAADVCRWVNCSVLAIPTELRME